MLTADTWTTLTDAMARLSSYVFDDPRVDSEGLKADGLRYLTRLVAGGSLVAMEMGDADYPQFVQPLNAKVQWGLPAVDAYYLAAPVKGGHTYRIHGNRGTARVFDVEVWSGDICHMGSSFTLESKCHDYTLGPDGQIEIILSSTEREGNWAKLPDGPGTVLVRQYFYDGDTEETGLLHIEREGAVYPPPPFDAAKAAERAQALADFLVEIPMMCLKAVDTYYAAGPDTVDFAPLSFGFADLMFGRGHYRCRPDEAVILETPAPDCFYWNYQLSNHFWQSLEWNVRQTAINGHQAVIDDDGMFRAVISHVDPGVPNWLDTAGRNTGLIAARYYRPSPITAPTLRVVPLDRLSHELPATTPTITPEQRQTSLRRRMLGARRTMRDD